VLRIIGGLAFRAADQCAEPDLMLFRALAMRESLTAESTQAWDVPLG
jgi:hypothetical protein